MKNITRIIVAFVLLHTAFATYIPSVTGIVGIDQTTQGSTNKVDAQNFNALFRESFDTYPGTRWTQSVASGDIVALDGNAAGSNYLVLSKDPLTANSTTTITSNLTVGMPIELSVGLSKSQHSLGQEFSTELVSPDTISAYTPVAISAIQQATTTLSVTTASNHGLVPGNAISIYGVNDSRMNYAALVVATVPAPNQFTCTAGPAGTIVSLSVGPFSTGYVTMRPRLGQAVSGSSMIFENTSATNASFYIRSNSGDALASGAASGSHSATIGSTASVQAVNTPYCYSFLPTTEFRLSAMSDRLQWADANVDATGQTTSRYVRTQVCPDNSKSYSLRFRAYNTPGLTVPICKIISMQKTASTTATVTTDVAHGLTTADVINIVGSSDQTNYANLLTATAVASVIDSTHFTVVIGISTTSTVYGGYVSRVNGNQVQQGMVPQVANNAVLATAADGTQALTLTGNAAWTTLSVGDYVNVLGLRSVPGTGSDLGCDGAWKVRSVSTTALELGPIGSTTPPANFGSTVCGGGVIKRSDLRINFVRIYDYDRLRVEAIARPSSDASAAMPVAVQNTTTVSATNLSCNVAQIAAAVPNTIVANGSTNKALGVSMSTAIANTDQSATAFAGSGRVNGTVVASPQGGGVSVSADINLTVTTIGTATALVPVLAESYDSGTTYTDIWTGTPMTATSHQRVPAIPVAGRRRWSMMSVGGTSTTVPATIIAQELAAVYPLQRQFVDVYAATNPTASIINGATVASTLVSTAGSSTSGVALIEGCSRISISGVFTGGTPTTAPIYTLQVSQDATNWISTSCTMSPTAAGTFGSTIANMCFRYARLIVSTASSGGTPYGVTYTAINGSN